MCVRVCGCVLCMLCAVLCYICSKNLKKSINMENKTGSNHGHNVVRKCKKNTRNIGKIIKTWLLFSHDMYGHPWTEKRSENGHFPDALFLRFTWDLPTFSAEGPIPNAQKTPFLTRGLIQRIMR